MCVCFKQMKNWRSVGEKSQQVGFETVIRVAAGSPKGRRNVMKF